MKHVLEQEESHAVARYCSRCGKKRLSCDCPNGYHVSELKKRDTLVIASI